MRNYKPKNNFRNDLLAGAAGSGFAAILVGYDVFQFACIATLGGLAAASVLHIVQKFVYWKLLPPASQLLYERVCPDCLSHGTLTEETRSDDKLRVSCESCRSCFEITKAGDGQVVAIKIGEYNE